MRLKFSNFSPIFSDGSSGAKKVKLTLSLKFEVVVEVQVVVLGSLMRRLNKVFSLSGLVEVKF